MSEPDGRSDPHDSLASFDREWPEFLDELRVALPGVQLLFGFLLAAPFTSNFPHHDLRLRHVFFTSFLCTTVACAFLIAPSVYHRLHWRRTVRDKEEMLRTCNRLAIAGVVMLAVAMACAVYVVSQMMADELVALIASSAAALCFLTLWFALPLARRGRDRKRPGSGS